MGQFLFYLVNREAIDHLQPQAEGYIGAVSRLVCCTSYSFVLLSSGVFCILAHV